MFKLTFIFMTMTGLIETDVKEFVSARNCVEFARLQTPVEPNAEYIGFICEPRQT